LNPFWGGRPLHFNLRRFSACLAVVGVGLVLHLAAKRDKSPAALPIGRISPPTMRVTADPKAGSVQVSFKVVNEGTTELTLGAPVTGCGCTVASVEPKIVAPGHSAVVTLSAKPPHAGEKPVEVRVPSNGFEAGDSQAGELVFHLTLVGDSKPPFVTSSTEAAQFGEVVPKDLHAEVSIDTREAEADTPWIDRVVSDLPGLKASGGVELARVLSPGVVWRRYQYELVFDQPPPPGEITGNLRFQTRGVGATPLTLPIRGRVLPPVYVRPSRLYARYHESEGPPRLRFAVVAADPETKLDAEPVVLAGDPFEIELKSRTQSRLEFVLTPRSKIQENLDAEVTLETNQPQATRVTIPVTLRRDPK